MDIKTKAMRVFLPALLLGTATTGAALLPTAAQAQARIFHGDRGFRGGQRGQLNWSGEVDQTVIVTVHGNSVRDRILQGKGITDETLSFQGRLPHRPSFVVLRGWTGRGDVRVIQQPRAENGFTAAVRIHDPQAGRGHYHFTLAWRPAGSRLRGFRG